VVDINPERKIERNNDAVVANRPLITPKQEKEIESSAPKIETIIISIRVFTLFNHIIYSIYDFSFSKFVKNLDKCPRLE